MQETNCRSAYGLGEVVVVVVVLVPGEVAAGDDVLMFVVVSVEVAGEGFTIVVLLSDFAAAGDDAGEAAGATTSVLCSHAPRSAALAKMQSNFFIVMDWLSSNGTRLNRREAAFRPCLAVVFSKAFAFARSI